MKNAKVPFPFLEVPTRSEKPRVKGLTIFCDINLSVRELNDLMEHQSDLLDYVKFVDHGAMIARYDQNWIRSKVDIYHDNDVRVFIGGVVYQVAALQGKAKEYFRSLLDLGFDTVEICEDAMGTQHTISQETRADHIKMAVDMGLEVFTEFGKKEAEEPVGAQETIDLMMIDFENGASKATVENTDIRLLMDSDPAPIIEIVKGVGLERLRFEAGPYGWPEVPLWCIDQFGPEVNLENIFVNQLSQLDGMRRRMARESGFTFVLEDGAQLSNVPDPKAFQ
ncbi:phosphosulfolactate synthase [Sulfitobacter sp. 20_GPM-1509m]|uniref:phosphosulfolactate synthase n=1 Tax=Sulfitobacter sp. 20_GPM-1509m TaxID=1380367 RepID=UPI00048B673A|nr:phosphosulfolactate synthase [Sulfitobacter sp. 20_GPM-1509m]